MTATASASSAIEGIPVAMAHQVPVRSSGRDHARGVGVEHPVVQRRRFGHELRELGRAEGDVHIRTTTGRTDVACPQCSSDDAARSVRADQVVTLDDLGLAGGVHDRDAGSFAIEGGCCGTGPEQGRHQRLPLDHRAQGFLHDRLSDLLGCFGGERGPDQVETERPGQPGDLGSGDGRTEANLIRPLDRNGRAAADLVGHPGAAEQLHAARRCRLGPRTSMINDRSRFDDDARQTMVGELERRGQPDRTSADDQHRCDDHATVTTPSLRRSVPDTPRLAA